MLAIGSVGSLRPSSAVGTPRLPRRLHRPARSASRSSTTPAATAAGLRPALARRGARRLDGRAAQALRDGGVYWQTIGPRFETPAEIRLIAAHADVVGMTIASECVVAGELGLAYAAVCVVDNLANGLGDGDARASPSSRPAAPPTPPACATVSTALPQLGAVGR